MVRTLNNGSKVLLCKKSILSLKIDSIHRRKIWNDWNELAVGLFMATFIFDFIKKYMRLHNQWDIEYEIHNLNAQKFKKRKKKKKINSV